MKRTLLTPAHAAWLADTVARNARTFGGWTMQADPDPDDPGTDDPAKDDPPKDDKKPYEGKSISEMSDAERAAYFEDKSRQSENRLKGVLKITGGKYGDDLKAEFDQLAELRDKGRTDGERAVEEAKSTTRAEVRKEFGTKLAAAEFRAALAHVADERRDQIIEGISLEKYLTEDGEVDTDKVKNYASTIAPADKEPGKRDPDYGGGKRRTSESTGVASGRDLFESRRKKSTTSTS